ncbi:C2H2 type zinc finger domain protein [Rutstroemia sp. NJR-2017a WRK4]|nr:C2H2 type zinc finger domain protein [Rutstroemia sp. NJR-2017a WRK4]
MSTQPSYSRSGNPIRQFYHSPPSIHTSDSGYGSAREMGPPSLDFPPQPIEIDLNNSRTLPNPSSSSAIPWESTTVLPSTFPDMNSTYGPMSRIQQLPVDRITPQAPLLQWYADNDGPWYPKGISEGITDERTSARARSGNRAPVAFGQYRQDPLENATFQFGAPPQSDSGYGTRRSDGNGSIFSADIADRDQDCHSLTGHPADFHSFQGMHDMLPPRDPRTTDIWPANLPTTEVSRLVCPGCNKTVKTKSELKKHQLRHTKPFTCTIAGCSREGGFSTPNDLERHVKSKHPSATLSRAEPTKKYRCNVSGCKSKDKAWPRLDNFRSHLKRVHDITSDRADYEDVIRCAEFLEHLEFTQDQMPSSTPMSADPEDVYSNEVADRSVPNVPSENRNKCHPMIQDLVNPTDKPLFPENKTMDCTTSIELDMPDSSSYSPETVQPSELLRDPTKGISRIPVESVLSAPVGGDSTIVSHRDHVEPPQRDSNILPAPSKGKRHGVISATDAALTEVIRTALADVKDVSDVSASPLGRKFLPNGRSSSADSCRSMQEENSSAVSDQLSNTTVSKEDSLAQDKAIEVLKTLHKLGYIIQKCPSPPRTQNPGSVAGNKSENQVTCPTCKKFKGRPCELKKHMKRHERPYGCTFLACKKSFGSKNDWKRHENTQHFQLETWRCNVERREGGECAKVSYRRPQFQQHLENEHQIKDAESVKTKLHACRIGRNSQERFWCGFCKKLVELKKKSLEAWAERFDHIDDHFMGRKDFPAQSIQDWVPINSDKPIGDDLTDLLDGQSTKDVSEDTSSTSNSSGGSSPHSLRNTGDSPANAIILNGDDPKLSRKRGRNDDGDRPKKVTKMTTVFYCCQCSEDAGNTFSEVCFECNHRVCNDCKKDCFKG